MQRIVTPSGEFHSYLGADFDLRELPATQALYEQPQQWVQLKGDPAIRAGLFHQAWVASPMDERIDETIYLRSGTLNIFKGIVSLTFFCDGSHYMPWDEFLDKRVGFWLGTGTATPAQA